MLLQHHQDSHLSTSPLLLFKEISRMEMLRRESSWCCNCKHGLSISFERIHKLLNLDAKNSTKDYSPLSFNAQMRRVSTTAIKEHTRRSV
eukprot:c24611_g1_i7 orf=103-372(-)